jgi:hypothetical protein
MGPLTNRYLCKNGEVRFLEWRSVSHTGRQLVYAAARDVTEKRHAQDLLEQAKEIKEKLQRQLVFADRMASVGTLAAGVAHEINNPLAYVSANIAMMLEELDRAGAERSTAHITDLRDMALEAQSGAERIRKIVRGLKTFSRAEEERRVVVDVRPVLELSINMTFNGASCSAASKCTAVGDYFSSAGWGYMVAEHWNGKTWRVTPTPLSHIESRGVSELNAVSCSAPAACTAVGDGFATPAARLVTVAMRWNGKTWVLQRTPNSPTAENELFSVSCSTATACTAIGSRGSVVGSRQSAILAAHWNGRAWKLQPVPAPSGGPGRMHAVACASATYCVAAGVNYAAGVNPPQPGGGRQWPVSVVWKGSTWKLAPVPHP